MSMVTVYVDNCIAYIICKHCNKKEQIHLDKDSSKIGVYSTCKNCRTNLQLIKSYKQCAEMLQNLERLGRNANERNHLAKRMGDMARETLSSLPVSPPGKIK